MSQDQKPAEVVKLTPRALVNYEAEMALLGGLMRLNGLWFKVQNIAAPEHFADQLNGRIYATMGRMIEAAQLVNWITVKSEIDSDPSLPQGDKTKSYAKIIENSVVTLLNIEDYAHAIRDLWMRRQMIERAQEIIHNAQTQFDISADETSSEAIAEMTKLQSSGRTTGISKRAVVESIVEGIMKPPPCFSSGIESLDNAMVGGFYAGRLYGFGARKKAGKTTLLATFSHNLNRARIQNSFFAGEMSPVEIEHKNVARELGINPIVFLKAPGRNLAQRVADYSAEMEDHTIYEPVPGITLDQLARLMATHITRYRSRVLLVDYWQLIQGKARDETQEAHQGKVAQFLAAFAKRYDVAVILSAQLNQEGNSRGGEGIRLSCDAYFVLHRQKDQVGAWMELADSRYAPYCNIGSDDQPGLWLHLGSHFSEDPPELRHFQEDET